MSAVHTVQVGGTQPYAIDIGPGLLGDGTRLAARARGRHALLLSDSHVAPLYADTVTDALRRARPGLQVAVHVMPAGESHKTLDSFSAAIDALATLGATRDATVFALGGGVVGDLAGFTAACWMRGIDCVQLPTTLLAMVDSSVGGKTAVDIPQGKNLVGAFHPPRAVIADTATLHSLPARELRAGLAEVVKYGAIGDPLFFQWLEAEREALLAGDAATGAFCHGQTPGLADCCLVPQVFNARRFGVDMSAFPTIVRIEQACLALPAFDQARPEHQPDANA